MAQVARRVAEVVMHLSVLPLVGSALAIRVRTQPFWEAVGRAAAAVTQEALLADRYTQHNNNHHV